MKITMNKNPETISRVYKFQLNHNNKNLKNNTSFNLKYQIKFRNTQIKIKNINELSNFKPNYNKII